MLFVSFVREYTSVLFLVLRGTSRDFAVVVVGAFVTVGAFVVAGVGFAVVALALAGFVVLTEGALVVGTS